MTRVYLVRPGSRHRLSECLLGRTPGVHLNELGKLQARHVAERLSNENIRMVYASPVARARETAGFIAERARVPLRVDDAFSEQEFGSWTRLTFTFLETDPLWSEFNRQRSCVTPPGGEPPLMVQQRALKRLEQLAREHAGNNIAIVTHADIIRSILCACDGVPLDDLLRYEIDLCSLTTLEHAGRWRILESGRPLPTPEATA